MSDENSVEVKIGVNDSDVASKMSAATTVIKSSVNSIKESFEGLKLSMEGVTSSFAAITAVLAGGAIFKDVVKTTLELTGEVTNLAKKLGISRDEASTLRTALHSIGVGSEEYVAIATKLDRTLRTNEKSLVDMGIATRDANGGYINQKDLITNALTAVMQYKEGTDRNLASMAAFGRGADDAAKLMKLNKDVMAEAKEETEAFGLVLGQDLADGAKKMKMAMATVSAATDAVEVSIGRAVLPTLIDFSDMLKDNAVPILGIVTDLVALFSGAMDVLGEVISGVMGLVKDIFVSCGEILGIFFDSSISGAQFFANTLAVIRVACIAFGLVINETFQAIKYMIDVLLIGPLKLFAAVAYAAFHLDWAGVKTAWANGTKDIEDITTKSTERMVKTAQDAGAKMNALLLGENQKKEEVPDKHVGGHKAWQGKSPKAKPEKDMLAAELAVKKAAYAAEENETKDALTRAQALYDDAYAHNLISTEEYYAAKLSIQNSTIDVEIEAKRREMTALKEQYAKAEAKDTPEGNKEILKFRAQMITLTSQLTILESKRAETEINNNAKMIDAERVRVDKLKTLGIDADEASALHELDMVDQVNQAKFAAQVLTSEQIIALDKAQEEKKYAVQLNAQVQRQQLAIGDPTMDPAALEAVNQKLLTLQQQHALAVQGMNLKMAADANSSYKTIENSLSSSLNSTISGLLANTTTLASGLKSILVSVGQIIVTELITKPLAAKVIAWAQEKIMNAGKVASSAAVAGAAGTASFAGAPWPIDMGAPAFGAAMAADAIGYEVAASAEGGYDIPAGVNPVTQLHQSEMVLPKEQADAVRDMSSQGSGPITINTSGGEFIHKNDLAKLLKQMNRNFVMAK